MASKIEIFQLVAQHLGQDQVIVDPDEQIPLTGTIRTVWDIARRSTLRGNNWNFATARAQLAPMEAAPAFGFSYQFQMPDDFLRLTDVVGMGGRGRDWRFEGGVVLASVQTLQIRYVFDLLETADWDDQFANALSLKIAALIAVNITGDENVRQGLRQDYEKAMADAQADDGQENPPIEFDEDSWILGRVAGGVWGGGYHPAGC